MRRGAKKVKAVWRAKRLRATAKRNNTMSEYHKAPKQVSAKSHESWRDEI